MQVKRSLSGALGNNYARPARSRQGSYLSVKVLPSTARPALAELPTVAPARLGTPVIVLAARDASVRAAPVSSFAHPSLSLPHVPTPLRAALPPRASHPSQR